MRNVAFRVKKRRSALAVDCYVWLQLVDRSPSHDDRRLTTILRYSDGTTRYFTMPVNQHLAYSNPTQYFRGMFPEADLEEI